MWKSSRRFEAPKRRSFGERLETRNLLSGSPLRLDSSAIDSSTHEAQAADSAAPALEFFRLAPLGSLTSASLDNRGSITEITKQADFTFFTEAGESISAIATPNDAGAILTVAYVEGPGTATAEGPGESVVLPIGNATTSGIATLRVTSNLPTDFSLDIYRNAILEASIIDSSPASPVNLAEAKLGVSGIHRYAALGSTSLAQSESTLFSEAFEVGNSSFRQSGLWHASDGRVNDGLEHHSGRGLYFGQSERTTRDLGTLTWDAELDTTNNSVWESMPSNREGTQWNFASTSNPGTSGPTSNLAGIREWYSFGPAATMNSLEEFSGDDGTEADASFELAFRPRDFSGTHVLFETGDNRDSVTMLLVDETLEIRVQDLDSASRSVFRSFVFDTENDVNQFHHIVVSVSPSRSTGESAVRFFVNGVEVGGPVSATRVLRDWSSEGAAGLGDANGDFADSDDTAVSAGFDGDIAFLRYYEGRLLGTSEVSAMYRNMTNGLDYVVGNYNTGQRAQGEAVSPTLNLFGASDYTLTFDTLIETEDSEEPFESVQVVVRNTFNQQEEVILDASEESLPFDTEGQWAQIEADLTPFAGQLIQVIFRFDSGDATDNNFEGWWIDNVAVTRSGTPMNDVDQYRVDLTEHAGRAVDIVLAGQAGADYSAQTLELWNADETELLATGSPNAGPGTRAKNYDLAIAGFHPPAPGAYVVRVTSNAQMADQVYGLLLSPGVVFDTEPNEESELLRHVGTMASSSMGYLRADAVQTYTDRNAFEANGESLSFEDFESGNVTNSGFKSFSGPLGQASNSAFPEGIVPGVSISSSRSGNLGLFGPEFFDQGDPGSKVVGPDEFAANTTVTFIEPVTAVGLDILANGQVSVRGHDEAGSLIFSSTIDAISTGTFFGATTTQPIHELRILEAQQTGEMIDNLTFGDARIAPSPDPDSIIVSLEAGDTATVRTDTPIDAAGNSPANTLIPQLNISGVGIELSDSGSGADGKNALISFTAPATGDYVIEVRAESGQGEYVFHVDGPTSICIPSVGDIDGDNEIGFSDFLILSGEFGASSPGIQADLDCDGSIGFSDFLILSGNFGRRV